MELIKKSKKIKSRKTPPNAEICAWCSSRISEYSKGSSRAKFQVSSKLMLVVKPTIKSGKINLIPNTAINIPKVRKIVCQNLFQFFRIEAFTTALSKDNDISSIRSIKKIHSA